ncbi:hypothetical protein [Marinifilum sp. D714]|uniref:hypothetical protein n=1 Tax=Marinifilum sp. D714 TaxID=2937523 RepID=UPI0027BB973C|nr:hypothetical protein [Marinifilum sp. D714]MDQ2179823.1 hypothetical protein [Marinifilum sp. D714]
MENEYNKPLNTPILFLIFNRIDTTKKVFESIKAVKPSKLYIASDGHRSDKQGESVIVKNIRDYVLSNIDWSCEVKTLFREVNLGCASAVGGAIDWFFENEEKGIILEDDCLPSKSFYHFCSENLDKYKNDSRITAITGDNFYKNELTKDSYFFSRFIFIWGWATWRESWSAHRKIMSRFSEIIETPITTLSINHKIANKRIIQNALDAEAGVVNTWDYQWILSNYFNHGLIVTPRVNLVQNIGFDGDATHTTNSRSELSVQTSEMELLLKHPMVMIPNNEYDNYLYSKIFLWESFYEKLMDFRNLPRRIILKLFKIFK